MIISPSFASRGAPLGREEGLRGKIRIATFGNPPLKSFSPLESHPRSIDLKVQYLQVCVRWKEEAFAVKASFFQEGARGDMDLSLEFANSFLFPSLSTSRRGFPKSSPSTGSTTARSASSPVTEKATSRRGFLNFGFSGQDEGFWADRSCLVDSLEPRFAFYYSESVRWKKEGFH